MVASNSDSPPSYPAARTANGPCAGSSVAARNAAEDAELVRRFKAGDEDSFVEIITRHRARVFAVALRYLRNHSDAEEITQDAFIRAHRGLAGFRGDSSLATWLHRIALNLSRNRFKYYSCRSRHATLSLDSALSDDSHATFSDLIASDVPSPSREATAGEFSELVIMCMEKLGERQREILTLRNGSRHSYGEIARTLGISIGTVKSRIGRAREKLRALLAKEDPDFVGNPSSFTWFEPIRPCGFVDVARA